MNADEKEYQEVFLAYWRDNCYRDILTATDKFKLMEAVKVCQSIRGKSGWEGFQVAMAKIPSEILYRLIKTMKIHHEAKREAGR